MYWTHNVNAEWMRLRRNFVTASQVSKFVPYTATGRTRDVSAQWEQWLGEYYSFEEPNTSSVGAAARGHFLERYAIAEYYHHTGIDPLYFWDDMLLARDRIGWSPDGCDVEQPNQLDETSPDGHLHLITDVDENDCEFLYSITYGVDVKSYSAAKHLATAFADKMKLEERWQLAAAMYVCDQIKRMDLILYNPESVGALYVHHYDRKELADELTIIDDINKTAHEKLQSVDTLHDSTAEFVCKHSQLMMSYKDIEKEYENFYLTE